MKKIIIIVSIIASVLLIGGALLLSASKSDQSTKFVPEEKPTKEYSLDEVKQGNGKDGNKCLVAVDATVYELPESLNWQDGKHVPSEGQAYCGADLTEAIKKAPHGRSKLDAMTEVGTLAKD